MRVLLQLSVYRQQISSAVHFHAVASVINNRPIGTIDPVTKVFEHLRHFAERQIVALNYFRESDTPKRRRDSARIIGRISQCANSAIIGVSNDQRNTLPRACW